MKDRSSQSRDQSQRRRPRYGKSGGGGPNGNKKKGRGNKDNYNGVVNGNRAGQDEGPGVCVRCGHPAPDGKLCNFHRSLLNSIRNDFGYKRPTRGPSSSSNFNY
jgi:hypothetical protein